MVVVSVLPKDNLGVGEGVFTDWVAGAAPEGSKLSSPSRHLAAALSTPDFSVGPLPMKRTVHLCFPSHELPPIGQKL